MNTVVFNLQKGSTIDVHFKQTNNKRMYMTIRKGLIVCSVPRHLEFEKALDFVKLHVDKFAEKIENNANNKKLVTRDHIYYLNNRYEICILPVTKVSEEQVQLSENTSTLYVYSRKRDQKIIEQKIKNWLKQECSRIIPSIVEDYEKRMGTKKHSIIYGNSNQVLGTNTPKLGQLRFSINILQMGFEVINYLVIHELAHDFYPNHSKSFWELVELHCLDYKEIKKHVRSFE